MLTFFHKRSGRRIRRKQSVGDCNGGRSMRQPTRPCRDGGTQTMAETADPDVDPLGNGARRRHRRIESTLRPPWNRRIHPPRTMDARMRLYAASPAVRTLRRYEATVRAWVRCGKGSMAENRGCVSAPDEEQNDSSWEFNDCCSSKPTARLPGRPQPAACNQTLSAGFERPERRAGGSGFPKAPPGASPSAWVCDRTETAAASSRLPARPRSRW